MCQSLIWGILGVNRRTDLGMLEAPFIHPTVTNTIAWAYIRHHPHLHLFSAFLQFVLLYLTWLAAKLGLDQEIYLFVNFRVCLFEWQRSIPCCLIQRQQSFSENSISGNALLPLNQTTWNASMSFTVFKTNNKKNWPTLEKNRKIAGLKKNASVNDALTKLFFATFKAISDYAILYLQPLWLVGTSKKK